MLKNKWKELSKWAYGLMFLVLALCLVLTQSRGCWIGFMLSVVIFVTFYEGKWWGFIPIVLCILPFIIPQTIVDRIMSVGNGGLVNIVSCIYLDGYARNDETLLARRYRYG